MGGVCIVGCTVCWIGDDVKAGSWEVDKADRGDATLDSASGRAERLYDTEKPAISIDESVRNSTNRAPRERIGAGSALPLKVCSNGAVAELPL